MNARQRAVGVAQLARSRCAFLLGLIVATSTAAESHWWMDQPVRLLQTNLRETDSTLDAQRLVRQVADFPANALLFNMGGIIAHYPTRVPFHYASPHLPPGRDLFGDVLQAAHARGIRVHQVRRARAVSLNKNLRVSTSGPYRRFTLPPLGPYEVVVLDE